MFVVYLSLGSNIDPDRNLRKAVQALMAVGPVDSISSAWETPPVGTSGANFLNAAVKIRTEKTPEGLKSQVLRRIEQQMGRVRTRDKFAPRTIDLDILLFNGNLMEANLWQQAHLAAPLAELLPDYQNLETHETLQQAAQRLLRSTPCRVRSDVFP